MKIIYGLNNLKKQNRKCAATIGIFDGVHKAHQAVLKRAISIAGKKHISSCVITFFPHPQKVISGPLAKSTIISLRHRLKLLEDLGIDLCLVIKFTPAFSKKPVEHFIENVLVKKLKTDTLVVGDKFRLGKEKLSAEKLKEITARASIRLKVVPAQKYKGSAISSSAIRELIEKGSLDIASRLLGRNVTIRGAVMPGKKLGRVLGFPTANINPHHEVVPPAGVYAVNVKLGARRYQGLLNIGFRPGFGEKRKEPVVEVHILRFRGDLYNKEIEVSFIRKIRQEFHFKDRESLRKRIEKDVQTFSLYKV